MIGGVAVALALLSACAGANDQGGDAKAFKLGALVGLTGDLAHQGVATSTAIKLAVSQANAAGGVNGVDVELEIADDGTDVTLAQTAMQRLVNKRVGAIVGTQSSAVCLSALTMAIQNKIPMIASSCTSPQLTKYADEGFFWRVAASSDIQGQIMAREVLKEHKNAAIIALNDAYGQPLADAFQSTFEELGGKVVARSNFDPVTKDFTAEVQKIAASDPEAIYMIAFSDTGSSIVRSGAKLGLLKKAWYLTNSNMDTGFPKSANADDPSALNGWKGIANMVPESETSKAFNSAYDTMHGNQPPAWSAEAYDAAWLAILAAAKAEKTDGAAVQKELRSVSKGPGPSCAPVDCLKLANDGKPFNYDGVSGPIEWNEDGEPTRNTFSIWTFDNSTIKTLETFEVKK